MEDVIGRGGWTVSGKETEAAGTSSLATGCGANPSDPLMRFHEAILSTLYDAIAALSRLIGTSEPPPDRHNGPGGQSNLAL
jgi:hypothetical protein